MSWASYAYDVHGELHGVNAPIGSPAARGRPAARRRQRRRLAHLPGRADEIGGSAFVPIASQRLKHIRDGLETSS